MRDGSCCHNQKAHEMNPIFISLFKGQVKETKKKNVPKENIKIKSLRCCSIYLYNTNPCPKKGP